MSKVFDGGIHTDDINANNAAANITLTTDNTNGVVVASTLNSTSATTGALVVNGGVGIASDVNTAGVLGFTADTGGAQITMFANASNSNIIDMNDNYISNLTDPMLAQDAATKSYVDTVAGGTVPFDVSVAATDGALGGSTGGTNTYTFAGPLTEIDGVTLSIGNQILIKDEAGASPTAAADNGIYIVTAVGSPFTADRVTNFENGDSVAQSTTFISGGTANAGSTFIVTNLSGSDVVGTDAIGFNLLSIITIPNLASVLLQGNNTGLTPINIQSGSSITSDAGVALNVVSGAGSTASLASNGSTVTGDVSVGSGVSTAGVSGAVSLTSGGATGGDSGDVTIGSGISSLSTGDVTVSSGSSLVGTTGSISLTSGAATSGAGGAVSLTVGSSGGTNDGSDVTITAGQSGSGGTSVGGDVTIVSGASTSTGGASGAVSISSGTPTDGNGGSVSITAAAGVGTNRDGGDIDITAGNSTGNGTGGSITYMTGDGTASGGAGGAYSVQTGDGVGAAAGPITLTGGNSDTSTAGAVSIVGGNGTGASSTAGSIQLNGGTGSGTNAVGGAIAITSGAGNGTGASGDVTLIAADHAAGTGAAGSVVIEAGDTSGSDTGGNVTITAGNRLATGGNVTLVAGTGTTDGNVEFTAHGATIPMNGSGADASLITTSQNIVGAINELSTAVGAVTQRIAFDLVGLEVRVSSTNFVEIAYLPWIGSLYGPAARNYTSGNLIIESVTTSGAPVLEVEVRGSVTGLLNSSILPTLDTFEALALDAGSQPGNTSERISLRVRNTGSGVASIFGASLEWVSNTP